MQGFFQPSSVVLIGVSRKTGTGAYNNLEMMLKYGYQGRVALVHPKVPEILGHHCYPNVAALPEVPDLAVISLGRERVLQSFQECVNKGIRRVIVISQGFADADERGRELQEELTGLAKKSGTRVMGPNTMGVLNAFTGFSTAFVDIAKDPAPPPLTIVVQSGVFQVGLESFTGRLGKAIDIGNACDLDFVDALEYLEHDPQTKIIAIHMEGMQRGREFVRVASRVARSKPIIVLKTGRSVAGARAALSHTGSLVGEDAVFDVAFARAGLIRVRNMIELHAVARAFLHFERLQGSKLGVVTATGACGIMTADACEDYGLELAPFPEELRGRLEIAHIAWHRLHNPVDVWPLGMVGGSFTDVFKRAACGLLEDDNVDAVLGIAPAMASPLHADLDMASALQEIQEANVRHKPVALWLYGGDQPGRCRSIDAIPDVACFDSIDEAVMGLAAVYRYTRYRRESEATPFSQPESTQGAPSRARLPSGLLVGQEAFEVLKEYRIPVAPGEMATSPEEAVSTATRVGYPVVLKIISAEWLHKSDLGGIRLNVNDESQLLESYGELRRLFAAASPRAALDGILVQRQVKGTELLLGIKRDPQFGSIFVTGMGGIYTEVFRDISRGLVPIGSKEAEQMLQALQIYPILAGIRGQQGIDFAALIDTMLALSRLAVDYPEIVELDLNPVVASTEGCYSVDCRIVVE